MEAKKLTASFFILEEGESSLVEKLRILQDAIHEIKGIKCEITVVNLEQQPEMAEEHQIIAIPTLIKEGPRPTMRIVGDINNIEEIVELLTGS